VQLRTRQGARRGIQTPWSEAGPPNHLDGGVDLDQWVVNQRLSLVDAEAGPSYGSWAVGPLKIAPERV